MKPKYLSISVNRIEDENYVLTVTYDNGVTGEIRVSLDERSRYEKSSAKSLCEMVFGRHHVYSLTALQKEEFLIEIEKAIQCYEKHLKGH